MMHVPVFDPALSDVHFVSDHLDRSVTDDEPKADYIDRTLRSIQEPPLCRAPPRTRL